MRRGNLKVVSRSEYYEGELYHKEKRGGSATSRSVVNSSLVGGLAESSSPAGSLAGAPVQSYHSLHSICYTPFSLDPRAVFATIQSFSRAGDTVLDPSSSSGCVGLESVLADRRGIVSTTDPIAQLISHAKSSPADISEVALVLQLTSLKAPVSSEDFQTYFSNFYDSKTYNEIVGSRRCFGSKDDHISRFITALILDLLHGKSAGNLSAYSPSEHALHPDIQGELNNQRRNYPDYRALPPRILRKAAQILQDGIPSSLRPGGEFSGFDVLTKEADNLSPLSTGSVNLSILNPNIPRFEEGLRRNWIREWYLGLSSKNVEGASKSQLKMELSTQETWNGAMNQILVELARVSKSGGKAAIFCDRYFHSLEESSSSLEVRDRVLDVVRNELSRYWSPECYLSLPTVKTALTGKKKASKNFRYRAATDGVLVLRRI